MDRPPSGSSHSAHVTFEPNDPGFSSLYVLLYSTADAWFSGVRSRSLSKMSPRCAKRLNFIAAPSASVSNELSLRFQCESSVAIASSNVRTASSWYFSKTIGLDNKRVSPRSVHPCSLSAYTS